MTVPTWQQAEKGDGLIWGKHPLIVARGYADKLHQRMAQLEESMAALIKEYERGGKRFDKPDYGTHRGAVFWLEITRGFLLWAEERPCLRPNAALCQQAQQAYWREINRARRWAHSVECQPPLGWRECELTLAILEGYLIWQRT